MHRNVYIQFPFISLKNTVYTALPKQRRLWGCKYIATAWGLQSLSLPWRECGSVMWSDVVTLVQMAIWVM